jgi:hypothetical protein
MPVVFSAMHCQSMPLSANLVQCRLNENTNGVDHNQCHVEANSCNAVANVVHLIVVECACKCTQHRCNALQFIASGLQCQLNGQVQYNAMPFNGTHWHTAAITCNVEVNQYKLKASPCQLLAHNMLKVLGGAWCRWCLPL